MTRHANAAEKHAAAHLRRQKATSLQAAEEAAKTAAESLIIAVSLSDNSRPLSFNLLRTAAVRIATNRVWNAVAHRATDLAACEDLDDDLGLVEAVAEKREEIVRRWAHGDGLRSAGLGYGNAFDLADGHAQHLGAAEFMAQTGDWPHMIKPWEVPADDAPTPDGNTLDASPED
ncbi:hypothetical protein [Kitasatospora sp. NPDC085464]|uniref:hypothetical protein n=1 Tax=Kitasatospora sp. NPDC085464 TaxID=3364063 RepID=UPI0037C640A8